MPRIQMSHDELLLAMLLVTKRAKFTFNDASYARYMTSGIEFNVCSGSLSRYKTVKPRCVRCALLAAACYTR